MLRFKVTWVCSICETAFDSQASVWTLVRIAWFHLLAQFAQDRLEAEIALCKDCEDLARERYDFR